MLNIFGFKTKKYTNTNRVTISDIVEVGIFIDGKFLGGSLNISIEIDYKYFCDKLVNALRDVIDQLDHCTISDYVKIDKKSKRYFLVEKITENPVNYVFDSIFSVIYWQLVKEHNIDHQILKDMKISIETYKKDLKVDFWVESTIPTYIIIKGESNENKHK